MFESDQKTGEHRVGVMKYNKKPDQVDAIQFVGGAPNGPEIVNWVLNLGGGAVWLDAQEPGVDENGATIPGRDEIIRLFTPTGMTAANKTDYVVRENGQFVVYKKVAFESKYAPASS